MVREILRSFVGFQKWISENQFRLCMCGTFSSGLQTRRELRSEWIPIIFATRLPTTFWTKESVFSTFKFLWDIPTLRQPQSIFSGLIREKPSRPFSGELGRKKVCRTSWILILRVKWFSNYTAFLYFQKFQKACWPAWNLLLRGLGWFWIKEIAITRFIILDPFFDSLFWNISNWR